MQDIITKYRSLLDKELKEQEYQTFIEENTQFAPRHFVQNHGVHFDLLITKMKISSDMITDFVILSKCSIEWNFILIELEKPQSKFFKKGTKKFHSDFISGFNQIKTWQAWFNVPENKLHFENQLKFVKKPISHAPVTMKYVLVTGRRSEFEDSQEKINLIKAQETGDFKIMSFDSLAENVSHNDELYLVSRRQNSFALKSNKVIRTNLFDWCDESDIQITKDLKNNLIAVYEKKLNDCKNGPLPSLMTDKIINQITKVSNMKEISLPY